VFSLLVGVVLDNEIINLLLGGLTFLDLLFEVAWRTVFSLVVINYFGE
jgi:hypothetical protein